MFQATIAGWAATLGLIGAVVGFDLWHSRRNPRPIGLREAAGWSLLYLAVAVLFGVVLALIAGWSIGGQYFAGYIVERSLSIDNLFVIAMLFAMFSVPAANQHRLLFWGVLGALVMRGAMIWLGSEMLHKYAWIVYVFGGLLILTGLKMLLFKEHEAHPEGNFIVRTSRRHPRSGTANDLVVHDRVDARGRD